MLTVASLVLTLDILRVINNEVAIPHHREIHRQLTDLHSLVQILEAKKKRQRRMRRRRWWKRCKKRGGFQWEVWEFADPRIPPRMPRYVLPKLPRSYITSSSESWQSGKRQEMGTAEQKLQLSFWPLEIVSLTASHALNSSLTFIVQVCAFVLMCVCVFVCVCESRRRREREESLMCMSAVPLGTYCTSQCVLDWRAEPRCILLQCNYLGCIYYVSTDSVTHICTQHTHTHTHTHTVTMAVWYGTDRNIVYVITNVTKSLERITHRPRPTELFWHCTLELLKRRAVTRWLTPWMWRTHS